MLEQYGVASIEELPVNFRGLALQAGEENGYRVFDRHYAALAETYERQQHVRAALGALFPLLAMQQVSMGLAGNDGEHHRHFANAAEQYRRHPQQVMNDDITHNSRFGATNYVAGRALWDRIGPFDYAPPSSGWALAHERGVLLLVLAWSAAALALAWFGVRHLRAV